MKMSDTILFVLTSHGVLCARYQSQFCFICNTLEVKFAIMSYKNYLGGVVEPIHYMEGTVITDFSSQRSTSTFLVKFYNAELHDMCSYIQTKAHS